MARYHLNLFKGVRFIDAEGMEIATLEQARRNALLVVSELIRTESTKSHPDEKWRLELTDGRVILFRVTINLDYAA